MVLYSHLIEIFVTTAEIVLMIDTDKELQEFRSCEHASQWGAWLQRATLADIDESALNVIISHLKKHNSVLVQDNQRLSTQVKFLQSKLSEYLDASNTE